MQHDTLLQTTNEDEHLVSKIMRAASQNYNKLDGFTKGIGNDKKNIMQMDFTLNIKQSPFLKFSIGSNKYLMNFK